MSNHENVLIKTIEEQQNAISEIKEILDEIITTCEEGEDAKDIIEDVLYKTNNAINWINLIRINLKAIIALNPLYKCTNQSKD